MFSGKLVKKKGVLVFSSDKETLSYKLFIEKIKDGESLDIYIEIIGEDHSKAQLAKVHKCIREIAKESGYTFNEVKEIIKNLSGLTGKSFADCSRDEIMLAIESCIQLGKEQFNLNLG